MEAMRRLAQRFLVENRVKLRRETFAFPEAAQMIAWAFQAPPTPSIAFNDHTSMAMRTFDTPIQDRAFEHSVDFRTALPSAPRLRDFTASRAKRTGQTEDAHLARLLSIWKRRPDVPSDIAKIAEMGRAKGAPMHSHDDTCSETRQ